jgi:hypothetical protein
MPLARYDKYFGGKGGARKALAAMRESYGSEEKAERVFYATLQKKRGGAVKGKD